MLLIVRLFSYVLYNFVLSRYLWAVKLPPLYSAGAKKLSGRLTARKRPLIIVSLYIEGLE
ncbi:hypothetical protein BW900_01005 [Bacillus mycoides]|uniref:Uncharacterized protein n=1 Tax=Bacillus mycoides TaxID=1405 RepID=A0A1S9TEW4_BACMY|nr:hypothetical protein BW900_01005 [Bacillus mycoides]RAN69711.1 hypothetical protein B5P40_10460 [Bacillus sp. SRB_8]